MSRMTRRERYPDTAAFTYYNANPRGRFSSDCVIRAICTALNVPWEDILREITEFAIKKSLMPNDPDCYGKFLEEKGFIKHKCPINSKGGKMTGTEFRNTLGLIHKPILAHIGSHHIVCIKNGKIHDTVDCEIRCIGNYWQMP